jgi:RES domain-containing protein
VSTFDVQALRVLDLTDPPTLLKLGVGLDTVMSLDNDRTQALANVAVSLGAEGLLAPSRVSSQAKVLVVFEHALDRVLVRKSELSVLRLPDDLDDPVVRARLAVDETMLRGFAAALSDERFDEWVASLTTVTDDLRERLRSSGRSLTD